MCNKCKKNNCNCIVNNTNIISDAAGRDGLSAKELLIRMGKLPVGATDGQFNAYVEGKKGDKGDQGPKGEPGEGAGNPDEEDITLASLGSEEVLQFKDRKYGAGNFVGKGYKILRRNIVNGFLLEGTIRIAKLPTVSGEITLNFGGTSFNVPINAGVRQQLRLRITKDPVNSGVVSVILNDVTTEVTIDVAVESTQALVAAKIANTLYSEYTAQQMTGGDSNLIVFTAKEVGPKNPNMDFLPGSTLVTHGKSQGTGGLDADTEKQVINYLHNFSFIGFSVNKTSNNELKVTSDIVQTSSGLISYNANGTGTELTLASKSLLGSRSVLKSTDFEANTIHSVRYDFSLNGQTITLPEGCLLHFEGGSMSGGSLIGNKTQIDATPTSELFKDSIYLGGSYDLLQAYPEWFGAKSHADTTGNELLAINVPAQVLGLPDSSKAINNALKLSVLGSCSLYFIGNMYKCLNRVVQPRRSRIVANTKTILCFYMNGEGNYVTTISKNSPYNTTRQRLTTGALALLENQYWETSCMEVAFETNSTEAYVEGDLTISLTQSSYTIGIYTLGRGYNQLDMAFGAPKLDIKVVGGYSSRIAPDVRDLYGDGVPPSTLGVQYQYYFDRVSKKYYQKGATAWALTSNLPNNGDSKYNVSFRLECNLSDMRIINPHVNLWDMFGFRGMEFILTNGGWFNDGVFTGTISNKHGSFISIFVDNAPGSTIGGNQDWSRIGMQIDNTLGHDTRLIYASQCGPIEFGYSWDLGWSGVKRYNSDVKYEFGLRTRGVKLIRIDDLKFVKDEGSNNLIPQYYPNKIDPDGINFAQYENILKYRTPDTSPGVSLVNFKEMREFNTLTTPAIMDEITFTANASPAITVPQVWFDEDRTTYRRVIDTANNLFGVYLVLTNNSNSTGEVGRSEGGFLEVEYVIDNFIHAGGNNDNDKPVYIYTNRGGLQFKSDNQPKSQRLPMDFGRTQNGYSMRRSKMYIPLAEANATRQYLNLGFFISENLPCTLDIYSIRLWIKGGSSFLLPFKYGTTAQRPNAVPKGFIYEDTTIGSTMVNINNSTEVQWAELPKEVVGLWTLTTGTVLTAATANYSKIGKQVTLSGILSFATASSAVTVVLPFAPNYGGVFTVGDLTFTMANNSTNMTITSAVVGNNKPFQLNYKTA